MAAGIIVATHTEADLLLGNLVSKETLTFQNKSFFSGQLNGKSRVVICICGVGKTNAAHGTTLLLDKFDANHVYSVGVAGAYPGSGLLVGDVAVAENEIYGDEGILTESGFHTIHEIGLPFNSVFPLLVPEKFKDIKWKGNFVSVSTCTGTHSAAREMEKRFNALCENMEGAAVAHICVLNNITVSEIRGISNIVGDRQAMPLDPTAIRTASRNVQEILLEKLSKQ